VWFSNLDNLIPNIYMFDWFKYSNIYTFDWFITFWHVIICWANVLYIRILLLTCLESYDRALSTELLYNYYISILFLIFIMHCNNYVYLINVNNIFYMVFVLFILQYVLVYFVTGYWEAVSAMHIGACELTASVVSINNFFITADVCINILLAH